MDRTACTELQYLYSIAVPLLLLCAVQPVQSPMQLKFVQNLYLSFLEKKVVNKLISFMYF